MLGHVSIRVLDVEASLKLYLSMLSPLEYEVTRFPQVVGLGCAKDSAPIPDLWLREYQSGPENNDCEKPTPIHFSFYVKERKQVDEFYSRALAAGAKSNGKLGLRPYIENYYCTFPLSSWPDLLSESRY